MKVAIVEDDYNDRMKNVKEVKDFFKRRNEEVELFLFDSPTKVLDFIEKKGKIDIYLMDIIMPKINGIELARIIRSEDKRCSFVFITISDEYAVSSFDVEPAFYIVKPYESARFNLAMNRAIEVAKIREDFLYIISKHEIKRIFISKLLYVYLGRNKHEFCSSDQSRFYFSNRAKIENELKRYRNLYAYTKNRYVNLDKIIDFEKRRVVLSNQKVLIIPRRKMQKFMDVYLDYISNRYNDDAE